MLIGIAPRQRETLGTAASLLAVALMLGVAGATSAMAATALDLAPAGDTFIQAGVEAGWDHGLDDHLRVDADIASIAYLKFDLSGVGAPVTRATLKLFCTDASPDGGTIYPLADSNWVEGDRTGRDSTSASGDGLTWTEVDRNGDGKIDGSDRGGSGEIEPNDDFVPDLAHPVAALGSVVAGQTVTVDVTAALQAGPGVYSLVIKSASTNGASYASRENASAGARPRLHLELADGQSVTTTTTVPTTVPPPTTTTVPTTEPPAPTTTTTTLPDAAPPVAKPAGQVHLLGAPSAACRLVAVVPAWSGKGAVARCTDGDTCDADGAADGSCTAPVTLCLESSAAGGCGATELAGLKLSSDPRLQALSAAFEVMKAHMPAAASEVCMPVMSLPVTKGRLPIKLQRSGKGAHKTLALVCRAKRGTHSKPPAPGPRPPRGGGDTFDTIQKKIFNTTCATPTCHGSAAASGGLNLAAGASYGNLVRVPAENPAAQASNEIRVIPGNPDSSFLFEKLTGNIKPSEGVRMPLVGRPLSAAELDLIRRWIAAGAPETAPF